MLRRGIVAILITVTGLSAVHADDGTTSGGLLRFLRTSSRSRGSAQPTNSLRSGVQRNGVAHAVVDDAERQVPEIRQVSEKPQRPLLRPSDQAPQPTPTQYPAGSQAQSDRASTVSMRLRSPATASVPVQPPQFAAPVLVSAPMPVPMSYVPTDSAGRPVVGSGAVHTYPAAAGGALYPAPRPGIPAYVGGTAIPNPAFHPHEMMHPHRYKAMYGPFYHKVRGKWLVTPFGVWSRENWKLLGTTVDVKYKSHISPFALFHPPVIR